MKQYLGAQGDHNASTHTGLFSGLPAPGRATGLGELRWVRVTFEDQIHIDRGFGFRSQVDLTGTALCGILA